MCATMTPGHDPVQKVTLIPRGQAKGLTWFIPGATLLPPLLLRSCAGAGRLGTGVCACRLLWAPRSRQPRRSSPSSLNPSLPPCLLPYPLLQARTRPSSPSTRSLRASWARWAGAPPRR